MEHSLSYLLFQLGSVLQIDDTLKDPNKAELFAEHIDQFLVVCTLQLRMVYSKHMDDADVDKNTVVSLYKCLLATVLAVRINFSQLRNFGFILIPRILCADLL